MRQICADISQVGDGIEEGISIIDWDSSVAHIV